VPIVTTAVVTQSRTYMPANSVCLLGNATAGANHTISVQVKVDVGSVTVGNRSLHAFKLN